jgi:NTE family protein
MRVILVAFLLIFCYNHRYLKIMTKTANRKKIGLALGSGGFRGFAHIGVIQVLLENKIPIDFISGASIGALAAAYYALHGEVQSLEKKVLDQKKTRIIGLSDFGFRGGLVSGRKYQLMIETLLGRHTFNDLKIPLRIMATNLGSGEPFIFNSGKLSLAVQASSSVPLVFEPVSHHGARFVDGALSNPVPVSILKQLGADEVIAVNLYHKNEFIEKHFTFTKVALRSTRIALYNLAQVSVKSAGVVINPDTSRYVDSTRITEYFDQKKVAALVAIGRKEAEKQLPAIRKLLAL